MKIEPLKKKPNAEDSSEDGEPMNDEYYALYLDDPAVPAFCSFSKLYIGQKEDLLKVADNFERNESYLETAKGIRDYFAGNTDAKHNIAYQTIPVLTPVRFIKASETVLKDIEWDHINTWNFVYRMKADTVTVSQILVSHDFRFYRCVRAELKGLCMKGFRSDWMSVGDFFFGHSSIFKITELPDDKRILESLLYVQEDESDVVWGLEQKIDDPSAVILDKICDEIFGDG